MSRYTDLLKDPRWQRLRLEVLDRDGWTCNDCGAADKTLHVHHKKYAASGAPWDTDSSDLETLCEDCHEQQTAQVRELTDLIRAMSSSKYEEILGFLKGLNDADRWPDAYPKPSLNSHEEVVGYLKAILAPGRLLIARMIATMDPVDLNIGSLYVEGLESFKLDDLPQHPDRGHQKEV